MRRLIRWIMVLVVCSVSYNIAYSQKWTINLSCGLEIRPKLIDIGLKDYFFSPNPIPTYNANLSLTGFSVSTLVGIYNNKHKYEVGLRYTIKYDHVFFDQQLVDTNWWSFSPGQSINAWLNDISVYLIKYIPVDNSLLGIEIGYGKMNMGSDFTFARYLGKTLNGDHKFIVEKWNFICNAIQLGVCIHSKNITSSLIVYYIGKNAHSYPERNIMLLPTISIHYNLSHLIMKSVR